MNMMYLKTRFSFLQLLSFLIADGVTASDYGSKDFRMTRGTRVGLSRSVY